MNPWRMSRKLFSSGDSRHNQIKSIGEIGGGMMQTWADYLEGIKSGAKIIPIRATG